MDEPRRLEIALPGVDLVALAWGDPGAPLALCLHGFPDTARTWRHLGPALAEAGFHVVAPYTRGYAPSGPARDGDYSVAALMRDAAGIRERLAPGGEAVLIGHDWGGITAQGLAADPEHPFARVVSLAIPPLWALSDAIGERMPGSVLALLGQTRRSWYIGFNQLPVLPERLIGPLVRRLWLTWSPGYDATEDLADVMASLSEPAHRSAAIGYYRALRRTRPDAPWLRSPLVPTLYLHGEDDGCLSPALSDMAGSGGVPETGHFLHLEHPERVNATVVEFLT